MFVNSRFITASESMWRFFKFNVHGRDPSVQHLAVHEEDKQTVVFKRIGNLKDFKRKGKQLSLLGFILTEKIMLPGYSSAMKFLKIMFGMTKNRNGVSEKEIRLEGEFTQQILCKVKGNTYICCYTTFLVPCPMVI